jgi:hypothetical protein
VAASHPPKLGPKYRPLEAEYRVWPLCIPLQGRAGWSLELEGGLLQNKFVCLRSCSASAFMLCIGMNARRVVVKASIGP